MLIEIRLGVLLPGVVSAAVHKGPVGVAGYKRALTLVWKAIISAPSLPRAQQVRMDDLGLSLHPSLQDMDLVHGFGWNGENASATGMPSTSSQISFLGPRRWTSIW
jgi:hypothetical protein